MQQWLFANLEHDLVLNLRLKTIPELIICFPYQYLKIVYRISNNTQYRKMKPNQDYFSEPELAEENFTCFRTYSRNPNDEPESDLFAHLYSGSDQSIDHPSISPQARDSTHISSSLSDNSLHTSGSNKPRARGKKIEKKGRDYRKNICGYITKKIIRQFIGNTFVSKIQLMCETEGADLKQCQRYYQNRIEKVTGPSHLQVILAPDCPENLSKVRVFTRFFEWFLRERYIRYLLSEGKMTQKSAYISYKNNSLFQLLKFNTRGC